MRTARPKSWKAPGGIASAFVSAVHVIRAISWSKSVPSICSGCTSSRWDILILQPATGW